MLECQTICDKSAKYPSSLLIGVSVANVECIKKYVWIVEKTMGLLENKNRIFQKLAEGKSRDEIYREFSEQSPDDEGRIAFSIGSIPTKESRKKYFMVNQFLFSLLIGYALLALTAAYPFDGLMTVFILMLKVCIPAFFSYYVYHFHGGLYRFLCVWCTIEMIDVTFKEEFHNIFSYSKGAVLVLILATTIFLCLKIFPHLGFLNAKKGDDGSYLLG